MVSGLVTSPCDQLRLFSGDARLMRIASKSAIGFAMSKGLERYKVFLHFLLSASTEYPVPSTELPSSRDRFIVSWGCDRSPAKLFLDSWCLHGRAPDLNTRYSVPGTRNLICCGRRHDRLLLSGLDQFHVQAERLQLANQYVER